MDLLTALLTLLKLAGVIVAGIAGIIATQPDKPSWKTLRWLINLGLQDFAKSFPKKNEALRWAVIGFAVAMLAQFVETLKTASEARAADRKEEIARTDDSNQLASIQNVLTNVMTNIDFTMKAVESSQRILLTVDSIKLEVMFELPGSNPVFQSAIDEFEGFRKAELPVISREDLPKGFRAESLNHITNYWVSADALKSPSLAGATATFRAVTANLDGLDDIQTRLAIAKDNNEGPLTVLTMQWNSHRPRFECDLKSQLTSLIYYPTNKKLFVVLTFTGKEDYGYWHSFRGPVGLNDFADAKFGILLKEALLWNGRTNVVTKLQPRWASISIGKNGLAHLNFDPGQVDADMGCIEFGGKIPKLNSLLDHTKYMPLPWHSEESK